jgi:integrase/recombinase XerD
MSPLEGTTQSVRLVHATAEYFVEGVPLQGHPLLLNSQLERLPAPNDYLYTLRCHEGLSPSTVNTYAWGLYDFFSWVEANREDWTRPSDPRNPLATPLLARYRNWQTQLSMSSGQPSLATIRHYLTVCRGFYKWASKEGLLSAELPLVRVSTKRKSKQASSPNAGSPAKGLPPQRGFAPKCMSLDQIKAVNSSIKNARDRLMVIFALGSGLRRSEIISFPAHLIPDHVPCTSAIDRISIDISPCPKGPAGESVMHIKGNVRRRIYVDAKIIEALSHYKAIGSGVVAARKYEDTYGAKPPRLFLSETGRPLANTHLNRICSRVTDTVGFAVWPHLLRHTFATHELLVESMRRPQIKALMWVRDRLGHANIATTQIYTSLLSELLPNEANTYQSYLSTLI